MSNFSLDMDGDGINDAVAVDMDGDGTDDGYAIDQNHDGTFETMAVDTNHDGFLDTVLHDTDGDGRLDGVSVDRDENGSFDLTAADTDGDGVVDVVSDDFDHGNDLVGGAPLQDGILPAQTDVGPATEPDPIETLLENLADKTGTVAWGPDDSDADGYFDSEDMRPHDPDRY